MSFVLDKLSIVDVVFGLPLKSYSMLESFIKVLSLPATEIPLAIIVPYQADVSEDYHGTVSVSLNHDVLVLYVEFSED